MRSPGFWIVDSLGVSVDTIGLEGDEVEPLVYESLAKALFVNPRLQLVKVTEGEVPVAYVGEVPSGYEGGISPWQGVVFRIAIHLLGSKGEVGRVHARATLHSLDAVKREPLHHAASLALMARQLKCIPMIGRRCTWTQSTSKPETRTMLAMKVFMLS